ncbi:MAG: hypothetical protein CM15mP18_3060 [Methanobacteriota archaeon]|nr:MAG: hypothetical protein CM15mP18_3060 [Euryarchaeota archaeon]
MQPLDVTPMLGSGAVWADVVDVVRRVEGLDSTGRPPPRSPTRHRGPVFHDRSRRFFAADATGHGRKGHQEGQQQGRRAHGKPRPFPFNLRPGGDERSFKRTRTAKVHGGRLLAVSPRRNAHQASGFLPRPQQALSSIGCVPRSLGREPDLRRCPHHRGGLGLSPGIYQGIDERSSRFLPPPRFLLEGAADVAHAPRNSASVTSCTWRGTVIGSQPFSGSLRKLRWW